MSRDLCATCVLPPSLTLSQLLPLPLLLKCCPQRLLLIYVEVAELEGVEIVSQAVVVVEVEVEVECEHVECVPLLAHQSQSSPLSLLSLSLSLFLSSSVSLGRSSGPSDKADQ